MVAAPVVAVVRPYMATNLYHWLIESVPRLIQLRAVVPLRADSTHHRAHALAAWRQREARAGGKADTAAERAAVEAGVPLVMPDTSLARQTLSLLGLANSTTGGAVLFYHSLIGRRMSFSGRVFEIEWRHRGAVDGGGSGAGGDAERVGYAWGDEVTTAEQPQPPRLGKLESAILQRQQGRYRAEAQVAIVQVMMHQIVMRNPRAQHLCKLSQPDRTSKPQP